MANILTDLLFHFNNGKYIDPALPDWAKNRELYNGGYISPGGHKTAFVANPAPGASDKSGKITSGFAKAALRAKMVFNGCDADGWGSTTKGHCIAEMTMSNNFSGDTVGLGEIACVMLTRSSGKFQASVGGQPFDKAKTSSAPLHFGLFPLYMEIPEFSQAFHAFCAAVDEDEQSSLLCYLADAAYNNAKYMTFDPDVSNLTKTNMEKASIRPDSYVGNFQRFPVGGVKKSSAKKAKAKAVTPTADFAGKYKFFTEELTDKQKSLVPRLDDTYIVGETLEMLCQHIKMSTNTPRPIRNILLRGEPGAGKTEMYVGIAYGCGLPLYTFAANAMTEPLDLFGQFVPVNDEGEETGNAVSLQSALGNSIDVNKIIEEANIDPVFTYEDITGVEKADATTTDCIMALMAKVSDGNQQGGGQRFKYVPGQLVSALKYGGVWGFDEVSLPQNAGVVPALNPAMDGTQAITLPTGEVVKRHPNCIFVATTNIDLEGCRRINQAWLDRCQLILDVKAPDDAELIARVKSMTGFDEQAYPDLKIETFIRAYNELQAISKKHGVDDGVIGPRKLADWVLSSMITNEPAVSANMTIISGATSETDVLEEMDEKIRAIFAA